MNRTLTPTRKETLITKKDYQDLKPRIRASVLDLPNEDFKIKKDVLNIKPVLKIQIQTPLIITKQSPLKDIIKKKEWSKPQNIKKMGFFKSLGKTLKREISFKNLVKVANTASGFIPGVGGVVQGQIQALQDAAAAKKAAQQAAAQGNSEQAAILQAQSDLASQNASKYVGSISKSVATTIAQATLNQAAAGISAGTTTAAGQFGATVVDSTINEWIKLHWKTAAAALISVFVVWKYIFPMMGKKKVSSYRRRY